MALEGKIIKYFLVVSLQKSHVFLLLLNLSDLECSCQKSI